MGEMVKADHEIINFCHRATSNNLGMKSVAGVVALGSVKAKCSERVPRNSSTRRFPPGSGGFRHEKTTHGEISVGGENGFAEDDITC